MGWLSDIQNPLKPDYLIVSGLRAETLKSILQDYFNSKPTADENPLDYDIRPGIVVYAHTKNRLILTFEEKLPLDKIFSIIHFLLNNKSFPEDAVVAGWTTVQTLHEQLIPLWDKRISIHPGQNEAGGFCLTMTTEENYNFRFDLINGVTSIDETSQFVEKSNVLKWPRKLLFSVRPKEERSEFFEHLDNMSFSEMLARAVSGWFFYAMGVLLIAAIIIWISENLQF
ncbi:MAG: hypothetical protein AAFP70_04885 [Calditrichota bacterium]